MWESGNITIRLEPRRVTNICRIFVSLFLCNEEDTAKIVNIRTYFTFPYCSSNNLHSGETQLPFRRRKCVKRKIYFHSVLALCDDGTCLWDENQDDQLRKPNFNAFCKLEQRKQNKWIKENRTEIVWINYLFKWNSAEVHDNFEINK